MCGQNKSAWAGVAAFWWIDFLFDIPVISLCVLDTAFLYISAVSDAVQWGTHCQSGQKGRSSGWVSCMKHCWKSACGVRLIHFWPGLSNLPGHQIGMLKHFYSAFVYVTLFVEPTWVIHQRFGGARVLLVSLTFFLLMDSVRSFLSVNVTLDRISRGFIYLQILFTTDIYF